MQRTDYMNRLIADSYEDAINSYFSGKEGGTLHDHWEKAVALNLILDASEQNQEAELLLIDTNWSALQAAKLIFQTKPTEHETV